MANIPFAIGQNQESLGLLADIQPFISGYGGARGALPYGLTTAEAIRISSQIRAAYGLSPQTSTAGFLQQNYYGVNPGSSSSPSSTVTAEQRQLDAARGIVRDINGNIVHEGSAIINETARAQDIARVQAEAGTTEPGQAVIKQAQTNISAANTLLDSINLKIQGQLALTGGETYAELFRAKQNLESTREAESRATGVSASFGSSPARQAYLKAVGQYQSALLAQPTQEVLSKLQPEGKTVSLLQLTEEAKQADIKFISDSLGFAMPLVEANYESGLNFKKNLGKQSYSNLLAVALKEFERTGKAYVPGLGYTLTKAPSVASSPLDLSEAMSLNPALMQSRPTTADQFERMGFDVVGGQSLVSGGESLLLKPREYMSRFEVVAQPKEFADVKGNFANLASTFGGAAGYLTGDFPLSQKNVEAALKGALVGPRLFKFYPLKGVLEFSEKITASIEGQMEKPEVIAAERARATSLGNPVLARQTILDLAVAPSKIPKAITGFPEFALVTGGGILEGYFLGLEGAVTGNFQPLNIRKEAVIRTLSNPSFLVQTGTQLLLFETLPKMIVEKPVTELRLELYKPKEFLKVEPGEAAISRVRSVGIAETETTGIYSKIIPGKVSKLALTPEEMARRASGETGLVKASKPVKAPIEKGDVILATTYTGKVSGVIYGKLGPSMLESVGDIAYRFEQGLIKRPANTLQEGVVTYPETPLGTFAGEFKTSEFNKPILLTTENFGSVTSTSLSSIAGRLDIAGERFPYSFRLTEFGKTEQLTPNFPSGIQITRNLLEGRTDLSANPQLAALIKIGKSQEGTRFAPGIPKDVEITSTLTEGKITRATPQYPGRFDIFGEKQGEVVLAKGFSINLLKFETKAGEATLSYSESFPLAESLKRSAAQEAYGNTGVLGNLGRAGKTTPSLSLTFNRIGEAKVNFKQLSDILEGNEPRYPGGYEEGGIGRKPFKAKPRGYNAGYGGGLELKGNAVLRMVGEKPKVKLLPAKSEGALGGAPNIDLAEQFKMILTKKGYTVVPKEAAGGIVFKAVSFQEKAATPISKQEGLFREVKTKGGMIQLQKVAPLETKTLSVSKSKAAPAQTKTAPAQAKTAPGKLKSAEAEAVKQAYALPKAKTLSPEGQLKFAEIAKAKAALFTKPKFKEAEAGKYAYGYKYAEGTKSGLAYREAEKVKEGLKVAQLVGLKQKVGQLTGQAEAQKTAQRTRLAQARPNPTPTPRLNPLNPAPATPRIIRPRKPLLPPGGESPLFAGKKEKGKGKLVIGGKASGARAVYADYLYAGRSQTLYGKATSPSSGRREAQAGIKSYFARVQTVEQLRHGGGNAFKPRTGKLFKRGLKPWGDSKRGSLRFLT